MSVTATANPTTTELHRALNDYTIHLTGEETETAVNTRSEPTVENPENWPEDYHGVPAYRPINRHLNREERPDGTNPIERLFIFTMLNGVWLNAVSRIYEQFWGAEADTFRRLSRKLGGRPEEG